MTLVTQAPPDQLPLSQLCRTLGLNRSAVYRRRRRSPGAPIDRSSKASVQPRALRGSELVAILNTLASEEFENQTPRALYHALLQRGICLASVSIFQRLLRKAGRSGERRNQRPPQHHEGPKFGSGSERSVDLGHHKASPYTPGDLPAVIRGYGSL